ncbi:MAG TPA: hypothetical protein VHU83_10400 [Bryobacteraceae bacterium]|jgi:hypothetical protein|nr:hypothetical protein [Bryobacteraceae bacterium]
MAQQNARYQPLSGKRGIHLGNVRAWRARDHLLLVENRFFTEHYTRLFWADIEAIVLYELQTRSSVLLSLELACLLSVLAPVFFWRAGWPSLAAFVFLLSYAIWRIGRPQWACEVDTRTNSKQFALPGTLIACRRLVEEIKNTVALAQGQLTETPQAQAALMDPMPQAVSYRPETLSKQPFLAMHVIAFVLGILSPFSVVVFVLYCPALIGAWFLQQDFRFPMAVRSAAAMSQIFAILRIAIWLLVVSRVRFYFAPVVFNHWRFGLPQIVFSLYGIAAVYWRSMELAKPQQKSATVLGLS